jgi:hypothetical protein
MKILHQTQNFLKGNEKSKDQYILIFYLMINFIMKFSLTIINS